MRARTSYSFTIASALGITWRIQPSRKSIIALLAIVCPKARMIFSIQCSIIIRTMLYNQYGFSLKENSLTMLVSAFSNKYLLLLANVAFFFLFFLYSKVRVIILHYLFKQYNILVYNPDRFPTYFCARVSMIFSKSKNEFYTRQRISFGEYRRNGSYTHGRGQAHYPHICIEVSAVSRCTRSVCGLTALQFAELDQ